MLRVHEKKVRKQWRSLKKKNPQKSNSAHVKKPKFLVLKPTLGRVLTSRNIKKIWRKFSLDSYVKVCLFQTFCNISSIFLPFNLLLVSLLTLPPTLQQISVAWLIMWSIHYMSLIMYRRALGITTMGDWRRVRDRGVERNFKIFSCFQCFK